MNKEISYQLKVKILEAIFNRHVLEKTALIDSKVQNCLKY